jgi:GntR family transcriptional regulator
LDKNGPIPLFYQLMEAIRYRIAVGEILPGEQLPPLREMAKLLDVNMHTVRRSYRELQKLGLVELNGAKGSRVTLKRTDKKTESGGIDKKLDQFLNDMIQQAMTKFSLSPDELAMRLDRLISVKTRSDDQIYFLECTESQSSDHQRELEALWDIRVTPLGLYSIENLPEGVIISTYFHFNEIRLRWPDRFRDILFVPIQPDHKIRREIQDRYPDPNQIQLRVCDKDELKAMAIKADLQRIFPPAEFDINLSIKKDPAGFFKDSGPEHILLFTPRIWDQLSEKEKKHPRSFKVTYQILPEQISNLGDKLKWRKKGDII